MKVSFVSFRTVGSVSVLVVREVYSRWMASRRRVFTVLGLGVECCQRGGCTTIRIKVQSKMCPQAFQETLSSLVDAMLSAFPEAPAGLYVD